MGDLGWFMYHRMSKSRGISYWIAIEEALRPLILWLPKETIKATMPTANTSCVIDCSENFLQKPTNLASRGESYSHYYSHNTINQYQVAVASCGVIMFILIRCQWTCQ